MDSRKFYRNNARRDIVDEESSGSGYIPTDIEELITDESSDADESDADDVEAISGEEKFFPEKRIVKPLKHRLLGIQFVHLYVCFPLQEKKNNVYHLVVVPKIEIPCQ